MRPTSPLDSPRSINFSRPLSPTGSPRPQASSPSPMQLQNRSPMGLSFSSPQEQKGASAASKGKNTRPAEGQRLADGSMHPSPSGTAVLSSGQPGVSSPKKKKKKKKQPSLDTQRAAALPNVQPNSAPIQTEPRQRASTGPSAEQIRAFQSRAAAMLARPLTDAPDPGPRSAPEPQRDLGAELAKSRHAPTQSLPSQSAKIDNKSSQTSNQSPSRLLGRTMSMGRAESISPARSAHFSESPLLEVTKHQPPPRSTSPVKSAMKTSPSPRQGSPAGSHSRDPSDQSDVKSQHSDEGGASGKKKKSVRVSFEEKPVLVGQAAEGFSNSAAGPVSPQLKKSIGEGTQVDELDAKMTPRPTLPSFGSVRGRKIRGEETEAAAPAAKSDNTSPSTSSVDQNRADSAGESAPDVGVSEDPPVDSTLAPAIAIQPATPLMEDTDQLSVAESEQEAAAAAAEKKALQSETVVPNNNPSVRDIADELKSGDRGDIGSEEEEEDANSDDSEVFSDAAEDPSEMEDSGGFASLDAILESPQTESAPQVQDNRGISSQIATGDGDEHAPATAITTDAAEPAPAHDWNLVSAFWSSLSDQKKQEIEQEARSEQPVRSTEEGMADEELTNPGKKALEEKQTIVTPNDLVMGEGEEASPPAHFQAAADNTGDRPIKSAMKQPHPSNHERIASEPIHMRKSMRTGGSMRSSLHESQRPAQRRPSRPVSADVSSPAAIKMAQQAGRPRSDVIASGASSKDSTPDKKTTSRRRGSASTTESTRVAMRRSMRDGPAPSKPQERLSSPSGSPRVSMRSSMRRSTDPSPSDRRASKTSSGLFGLGKSSKQPKPAKPKPAKSSGPTISASRFTSRLDDSSDEEVERPTFTSRFADSDDSDEEVMPMKLAPVRGIPRKSGQEEGDSTDLSDSDDEQARPSEPKKKGEERPPTPPAQNLLNMASAAKAPEPDEKTTEEPKTNGSPAEGKVLSAGTLRTHDEKEPSKETKSSNRRSFFGLGKKKEPGSVDISASKWAVLAADATAPSSPIQQKSAARPTTQEGPTSSPTRNSAAFQTSRSSRIMRRISHRDSEVKSAPTSPASKTADAKAVAEFPFPPPPIPEEFRDEYGKNDADGADRRPNTSDGISLRGGGKGARPGLGDKRQSVVTAPEAGDAGEGSDGAAPGSPSVGRRGTGGSVAGGNGKGRLQKRREPVYSERTGRKKKFQGLRRVFGLND